MDNNIAMAAVVAKQDNQDTKHNLHVIQFNLNGIVFYKINYMLNH